MFLLDRTPAKEPTCLSFLFLVIDHVVCYITKHAWTQAFKNEHAQYAFGLRRLELEEADADQQLKDQEASGGQHPAEELVKYIVASKKASYNRRGSYPMSR